MSTTATQLILTPTFSNKQLVIGGTGMPAAYETVAVTVIGMSDVSANLVLRIVSECGRLEYGKFPANIGETWTTSGSDLTCSLNLDTPGTLLAFRNQALNAYRSVRVLLENGATNNLYADGGLCIRNWVQNPLDPTVGSAQMQAQITVLTERIGTHQHDGGTESEAFPHNNLTDRDAAGVHPTLEAGVLGAVAFAQQAQNAADVAAQNAAVAQAAAEAAGTVTAVVADGGAFEFVSEAVGTLRQTKALVNQIVTYLNGVRGTV